MDIYGNMPVNRIETKLLCISSSNFAEMLTMVIPIDFGGHSSKVKFTMGIIDKCGVRGDATLCVVIFIFLLLLLISMTNPLLLLLQTTSKRFLVNHDVMSLYDLTSQGVHLRESVFAEAGKDN